MCVPTVCGLKLVKFDISLFPYPDKMKDKIFLSCPESEDILSIIFLKILNSIIIVRNEQYLQ